MLILLNQYTDRPHPAAVLRINTKEIVLKRSAGDKAIASSTVSCKYIANPTAGLLNSIIFLSLNREIMPFPLRNQFAPGHELQSRVGRSLRDLQLAPKLPLRNTEVGGLVGDRDVPRGSQRMAVRELQARQLA